MTNEDMQRTMEFILERQQQFAIDIQLLRETQTEFQKQQAAFDVRLMRLAESTLVAFGKLAEAQKVTGERLDALIGAVERIITGERNGKNPKRAPKKG